MFPLKEDISLVENISIGEQCNIAIGGKYLKTILGEQYFTRRKIFLQEMLETWIDK